MVSTSHSQKFGTQAMVNLRLVSYLYAPNCAYVHPPKHPYQQNCNQQCWPDSPISPEHADSFQCRWLMSSAFRLRLRLRSLARLTVEFCVRHGRQQRTCSFGERRCLRQMWARDVCRPSRVQAFSSTLVHRITTRDEPV